MTRDERVGRAVLELALAPVVGLAAFRLVALGLSWVGFESVAEAFVAMLWSAPTPTVIAYLVVLVAGVPALLAIQRSSPVPRWPVVATRAACCFVVVFGLVGLLPTPALIVAGVAVAVLAGQAAARVRRGTHGPSP